MTEDDLVVLNQYSYPTEVEFGEDRVHVHNLNMIERDAIETFDARANDGDLSVGFTFSDCSGSVTTSTVTFSTWKKSGSLYLGKSIPSLLCFAGISDNLTALSYHRTSS